MSSARLGGRALRPLHGVFLLFAAMPALANALPKPADWVPARWPWPDVQSLDLLAGSPVNCLLLEKYSATFAAAAADRGLVTLAVVRPEAEAAEAARRALTAGISGLVLQGSFSDHARAAASQAAGNKPVIEFTSRGAMQLGGTAPILATFQGVWPGVPEDEHNAKMAGPTGSVWINTNSGFIRAVRAWGDTPVWIANEPPVRTVITGARYLQAIADGAASGARWVLAFDPDFAARLEHRDPAVLADWHRMNTLLTWFEKHREWRRMPEYGKLAVVQDPSKGGLLSGGILDMIAVKHTPVRAVPRQHLTPEALSGATMAVNVDGDALSSEQKEILRSFTRSGGTLPTAPPGWQDHAPPGDRITLDKAELERLNDIWRDVNSMVGRRNLGVRLFNVATMLSNVLISTDGKTEIVHLVNYADYPVENISMEFLGDYRRATLLTPDAPEESLEIYRNEDSRGVDIPKITVCATIRLEQ